MALKRFTYPKTSATVSFTEDATAVNGAALPAKVKVVAGYDGANVRVVKTDSTGAVAVNTISSALPTGAATSANQSTEITSLSSIDGKLASLGQKAMAGSEPVVIASDQSAIPVSQSGTWNLSNISGAISLPTGAATSALQTTGNTSLSSIDGKTPALGQALAAASVPVVLTAAQITTLTPLSTIAATQSGTWNLTNISGTISLPTGAATSALQTTGNTSLASIDGKVAANYGVATGAIRTAAQVGNASGIADFGTGTLSAQTLRVVQASDTPTTLGGASGNSPGSSTVSTAATITAPASAVGFILQCLDTSTANVRWRIGGTASTSSGQQLQPGRDSGFVPCRANISICAESGTQNYDVQWVIQ